MKTIRILFLCIHNSARSQMAEAYLNYFGGEKFNAESAGLEAGKLNLLVVEVMKEEGIDISGNQTKEVDSFLKTGKHFDYVITVCDEASAARCPVFPGVHRKINWNLPDPSSLAGTTDEKLAATRAIRNKIKEAVVLLIQELG